MELPYFLLRGLVGPTGILRALRRRNYRLFFIGQGLSLIGTWMQSAALAWLVYRLTQSPFALGIVGFAGQIPTFCLAPFAGVLADRWDRRRILLTTQTLFMVQAFSLAFLALTGAIAFWHIVALSVIAGTLTSIDVPARQSFILEMVEEREDLGNAIALQSSMFNSARLLGASVAGALIATVGERTCFLINGISFLPAIAAFLAMRIRPTSKDVPSTHVYQELKEGFRYAFGFLPIRAILLFLVPVSLLGVPYMVLAPVMAARVLHGGPHAYGFLMAAPGVGALVGAVYLAARKNVVGLGRVIALASGLFGLSLIGFSLSRILWLSLVFVAFAGLGLIVQVASSNTVLQTIVDDDKRGRVMSLYSMAFLGVAPFGNLLAGGLASVMGAPATIFLGGIACILGALVFARRLPSIGRVVRPIYVRMGILPEVEPGIHTSVEVIVPTEE